MIDNINKGIRNKRYKNILLINPPKNLGKIYSKLKQVCPPINLIMIGTVLEKHGHNVQILDFEISTIESLKIILNKNIFDYIGIGSVTSSFNETIELIKKIKKLSNAKIVLGGPHPSALPKESLRYGDYVIIGDGEEAFLNIINNPANKINKQFTKNIDIIPNYDLIDINQYGKGWIYSLKNPSYPIYTARGCPMGCKFCQKLTKYREINLNIVFKNIELLVNKYGMKHMIVMDSTFALNKKRTIKFCNYLKENFPKLKWDCMARTDMLDEEKIKTMSKANCISIGIGIETANQDLRNFLGKPDSIKNIKKIMKLLKKYKIESRCYYILACPEEKKKDVLNTIKLAKLLNANYSQFTIFTPLPDTYYFNKFRDNGLITTYNWSKYSTFESVYKHKYLTFDEITSLLKKAHKEIYFNPKFLSMQLLRLIKNPLRFSVYLRGLKGVFQALKD